MWFSMLRSPHKTEPRVLPYKPAAIVHVARNVVGLTPQKYRFSIPCIKPQLIATKKCRTPRPVRSCPAVNSEKDDQKLQYFLWICHWSTDFRVLRRVAFTMCSESRSGKANTHDQTDQRPQSPRIRVLFIPPGTCFFGCVARFDHHVPEIRQ
jgi:hypothetical protein